MRAKTVTMLMLALALLVSPVRAYPAATTYYVRPGGTFDYVYLPVVLRTW